MSRFLEALRSGRVLLMDGAMGTELQRAGIQPDECYEQWNLTHPERVRAIHQAYVDAGAEVLLTNTFQANRVGLQRHQLEESLSQIVTEGLTLAHSVAGEQRFVLADIGPVGERRGLGDMEAWLRCVRTADAILVETASDVFDLVHGLKASDVLLPRVLPVCWSLTFLRTEDGSLRTQTRLSPEACAVHANKYMGVSALGVNCGRDIGMDEVIEIARRYRSVTDLPLFARPNAGTPTRVGDCWIYPHTPGQMASRLPELLDAGVSMVGGCCGTTPDHIAAFRREIDVWNAKKCARV